MKAVVRKLWIDQSGSTIITVLVVTMMITTTLLILLGFVSHHHRFVLRKEHFLKAKYAVESGVHFVVYDLQNDWRQSPWKGNRRYFRELTLTDTVRFNQQLWGGFLRLQARARAKNQRYQREVLLGLKPPEILKYAVVINPHFYSLVVTGDTRIYGKALVGKAGVKKESLRGRPYTGQKTIYGDITRTSEDLRLSVDRDYLDYLFGDFQATLNKTQYAKLSDFLPDSGRVIDFSRLTLRTPVYVDTAVVNERDWRVIGPVNLICKAPLKLRTRFSCSNSVKVICAEEICLDKGGDFRDVIFYSPKRIRLRNVDVEGGQFFSESGITLKDSTVCRYPSLIMVYSESDTAGVSILPTASVSGCVIYAGKKQTLVPTDNRGKVFVAKNGFVNGLLYSDNLVTLEGTVNGSVITDRFHFYHSPTHYYNWIRDGIVDRNRLNELFSLPLFFKQEKPLIRPI